MATNPLSQLIIDYWYKAMLIITTTMLILSLTVPLQDVSNTAVQIISLGGMLLSIGEWINHPLQTGIWHSATGSPATGKTTSYNRKPSTLGNLFDILGFLLIVIGGYRLIFS